MIPKVIHYCWFGRNPIPDDAAKCIASWKKYCPDYTIIEWNEDNYNINKNKYMSDAYKEKKWAFVSDYVRIDVVYEYGGIYLDTDVELLKPLDKFLDCELFCGWEERNPLLDEMHISYENSVSFGLGFGAIAKNKVLKRILDIYENTSFYNEDGSLNLLASPHYQTEALIESGLDVSARTRQSFRGIEVYQEDYFSPKSQLTGEITLTDNTVSIHHFSMSWTDKKDNYYVRLQWKLTKILGYKIARIVIKVLSLPYKIKKLI